LKKLINGVLEFRRSKRAEVLNTFAQLALGQSPDVLLIACSDSRVAVNVFASTDPGDMFVMRNVGNLVPPYKDVENNPASAVAAAVEFAVERLKVGHIIVCGHSDCGAVKAMAEGEPPEPGLRNWLKSGDPGPPQDFLEPAAEDWPAIEHQSHWNALAQVEHLRQYPSVRKALVEGRLQLHAWWFDLHHAEVQVYVPEEKRFCVLDEEVGQNLLKKVGDKKE
jgi:carbonic anhydrase